MMNSNKLILIVEDDDSIRELLQELLSYEGYEVQLANHGGHAIELLKEGLRPAAILLDLSMAVMDGKTFLLELPEQVPEAAKTPILLMTAAGTNEIPKHPASRILRKPLDVDKMLEAISKVMKR